MKNLSIVFIILASCLGSQAQNKKCVEVLSSSYVKGNLEYEVRSSYSDKNLILSKEEQRIFYYGEKYIAKTVYAYDQKNNLISVQNFKDGVLLNTLNYAYDTNGKLISENTSKQGSNNFLNSNILANKNSQKLYFEEDGSVSGKEDKVFDDNGKVIKNTIYGPQNRIFVIEDNLYSSTGKLLSEKKNEVLAKNLIENTFTYDAQDKLLEDQTIQNGIMTAKTKYQYDNKKNLIKKERFNHQNKLEYYIDYVYDNKNNLSSETFYYNNIKFSVINYTYDAGNNKIKEEHYDKENALLRIKNWEYLCK